MIQTRSAEDLQGEWTLLVDFLPFIQRETTSVTCVCFPAHQISFGKGSSLKQKDFLRSKFFPCSVGPYWQGSKPHFWQRVASPSLQVHLFPFNAWRYSYIRRCSISDVQVWVLGCFVLKACTDGKPVSVFQKISLKHAIFLKCSLLLHIVSCMTFSVRTLRIFSMTV